MKNISLVLAFLLLIGGVCPILSGAEEPKTKAAKELEKIIKDLIAENPQEVIDRLKEAIRLKPDEVSIRFFLGVVYSEIGKHQEAIAELKEAIRIFPNNAEAHSFLGYAYEKVGKIEEAIAEHKESIRIDPNDVKHHGSLVRTYGLIGMQQEMSREIDEIFRLSKLETPTAQNNPPKHGDAKVHKNYSVVEELKERILENPDDTFAHSSLGYIYASKGELEKAIDERKEVIRIEPYNAEAYLTLGNAYSRAGKQEEAIARYREAINIQPGYGIAHYNLGIAYSKLGNQGAVAEYKEAIRLNPDFAAAYFQLGIYYDTIKNGPSAIVNMSIAAKLFERAGDSENTPDAKKYLRLLYKKYAYNPDDFISVDIPANKSSTGKQAYATQPAQPSSPRQVEVTSPAIRAIGTGFVFGPSNGILTSYHIVKNAREIRVKFQNGQQAKAKIVFKDEAGDIALLNLDQAPKLLMVNIVLGDSKKMQLGDKVFTMGFPMVNILGGNLRYAEGVISALSGIKGDSNSFQVSVPIQKGNSGGPLFNERNELVGIISSTLDARNTAEITGNIPQNVNFAVKSSLVSKVLALWPGSIVDTTGIVPVAISFKEQVKNNIVLIEAE